MKVSVPKLSQHLECWVTKLCICNMVDAVHTKQFLKTRFYFNYLTCYSGTNPQDGQDFIPNFLFS